MAERRARESEDAGEKGEDRRTVDPPSTVLRNGARSGGKDDFPTSSTPPPFPAPPAAGPWRSYKEIVAQLAARIVEAQRPIRVLQALRWDDAVEEQFLKAKAARAAEGRRRATTSAVDLGFDPQRQGEEFEQIARDIDRELGETRRHRATSCRRPRSSTATSCACSRRAARRPSTPTRASSTARPRTSSPTASRPCATSASCSTASSRTSTSGRCLARGVPAYARTIDARRGGASSSSERFARYFGDDDGARRGRRRASSPTPPPAATT